MGPFKSAFIVAAVGGVGVAGGLVAAGPAGAEPLTGSYTATVIDGARVIKPGTTRQMTMTPCGPDCTHVVVEGTPMVVDLHPEGPTWVGTYLGDDGHPFQWSLDANATNLTMVSGGDFTYRWSLVKNP
jgi:hypothetical protein